MRFKADGMRRNSVLMETADREKYDRMTSGEIS